MSLPGAPADRRSRAIRKPGRTHDRFLHPLARARRAGTGQFRSLQDAIFAAPTARAGKPWIIRVRPGTYREANVPGPDGRPIGTFRTHDD